MTKEIIMPWKEQTFTILVDDDSHALLSRHTWYIMFSGPEKKPYAFAEIYSKAQGKRMLYMHQIVTGSYSETDHLNHDTLDNQFHNLRTATSQENGWNKGKPNFKRKNVTSQFKGVRKEIKKKGGVKWLAYFKHVEHGAHKSTGKMIWIGRFDTEIEAAKAYNEAIMKYRGKFAWVNPIPENGESLNINGLQDYPARDRDNAND